MDTKALKNKILQLAIQGKLVPQHPKDEPASVLLEKIKEEKEKPLPPITEEEIPFEIPDSWQWGRLGEIVELFNGRAYKKHELLLEGKTPVLRVGNFFTNQNWYYSDLELDEDKYCDKGDLLYAWSASFGPKIWDGGRAIYHYHIWKISIHGEINKKYLYYMLLKDVNDIKSDTTGSTMIHISKMKMEKRIFPLPPLAEQKRIVEKVDALFSLIDTLDFNKDQLQETINITRNKVLEEAVQGKLVPQNPEDEPASVLLEKIKEEKERLIKEKKIKKQKPLPPITQEEIPFEIPEGWEWVRLSDISIVNMGQSPKGDTVNDREGMEFHQGKVFFGDKYLNRSDKYTTNPKKIAQEGDVLISVRAPVGNVNITSRKICIGRGLCAVSTLGIISKEYYFYFILAFEDYLISKATGTTFLAVTASTINEMVLPLPPLAEQKRIVEKVGKIMTLCDELEKQINNKYVE